MVRLIVCENHPRLLIVIHLSCATGRLSPPSGGERCHQAVRRPIEIGLDEG
jgi:hypothetical protein